MADETVTVAAENPTPEASQDDNQSLLNLNTTEETETTEAPAEVPHLAQDPEATEPTAQEVTPPPAVERPENIPEKFWDTEKGEARFDDILKANKELETKLSSGKHKMPKDGKYDLEGIHDQLDPEDAMVGDFLDIARDEGLSQSSVERLVKFHLESMGALEGEVALQRESEMAKLGRNADKVISGLDTWLNKFQSSGVLNKDELAAIGTASRSAEFVAALNKIRRSSFEPTVPSSNQVEAPQASVDDLTSMMANELYGQDTPEGRVHTRKTEQLAYALQGEKYPG